MTAGASLDPASLRAAVEGNTLLLEATYHAYTPWAGGCARNSTLVVEGGRVAGVCLPDAKGLVGRARWLGRIAVATALGKNIDMREAEKPVARLLGSTSEASTVRVVVESLNDPAKIVAVLDKAYQAAASKASTPQRGKPNYLAMLLGEIGRASGDPRFGDLAGNKRLGLAVMGRKKLEEVAAKTPLPPGLLGGFKLKVYLRPGADKARASLAAALLAATPLLAGLGAMTSRGFGRFCLEGYQGGGGAEDILEDLTCESLARLTAQSAAELVAGLHRTLGERLLGVASPKGKQGHTPILDEELTTAVTLNTGVYEALNKIAVAATKQCWKSVRRLKTTSPGANLHTWPLGLPRQQRTGGYSIAGGPNRMCVPSLIGEPGRRLSMIHLYPLPPAGQRVNVVVAVYRAYDLNSLLDGGSRRLYHVGKYVVGRQGKRLIFSKQYHYVAVSDVASSAAIPDPCGTQHWEKGGILAPQGSAQGPLLDAALRAARDFVVEGLRRC